MSIHSPLVFNHSMTLNMIDNMLTNGPCASSSDLLQIAIRMGISVKEIKLGIFSNRNLNLDVLFLFLSKCVYCEKIDFSYCEEISDEFIEKFSAFYNSTNSAALNTFYLRHLPLITQNSLITLNSIRSLKNVHLEENIRLKLTADLAFNFRINQIEACNYGGW